MSYSRAVKHLTAHQSGYEMNSPLLFGLLQKFDNDREYQLLDVTPANQYLLNQLEHLHCKLHLPGCDEQLLNFKLESYDNENALTRALARQLMLYKKDEVKLDLILLWDLVNYLQPALLSALIRFLLPHCQEHAVIHCYVHTREQMPGLPAQIRFNGQQKLYVEQRVEQTVNSPMFYKESLQKLVSPFLVEKGMLLSNGLQEYLLRRR